MFLKAFSLFLEVPRSESWTWRYACFDATEPAISIPGDNVIHPVSDGPRDDFYCADKLPCAAQVTGHTNCCIRFHVGLSIDNEYESLRVRWVKPQLTEEPCSRRRLQRREAKRRGSFVIENELHGARAKIAYTVENHDVAQPIQPNGVGCSSLPTQTLPSASVRRTVNPAPRYMLRGPK